MRPDTEYAREHLGNTVGIHLRTLAADGPQSARRRGKQLADDAQRESGLPAIVVLRDPVSEQAAVCALSADHSPGTTATPGLFAVMSWQRETSDSVIVSATSPVLLTL